MNIQICSHQYFNNIFNSLGYPSDVIPTNNIDISMERIIIFTKYVINQYEFFFCEFNSDSICTFKILII